MKSLWPALLCVPLLVSCLVPLGYTQAKAQGMVSESDSAQYLQLSIQYFQKGADARSAAGTDNQALAASLDALAAEFQSKVDMVTKGASADDTYVVSDDLVIPKRTMAGVAYGEATQAVAQGRSLTDFSAAEQQEYQKVTAAVTGARGLFMANQSIWPQNMVNYRWAGAGNLSSDHRQALLDAMAAWTTATNGLVKFQELDDSPWTNFQLTIGVLGCVVFQDAALGPNVTGLATIGYQCGSVFGYLKISPGLPAGLSLQRTTLHELGHVLGLVHEHQRPDRDQWIDVASAGYTVGANDMAIVPESLSTMIWEPVQVRVGPWSVTLYFPSWGTHQNAVLSGQFDMDSIMIYSGFRTLKDWTDQGTGVTIPAGSYVPWNTTLSSGDLQAIQQLYH